MSKNFLRRLDVAARLQRRCKSAAAVVTTAAARTTSMPKQTHERSICFCTVPLRIWTFVCYYKLFSLFFHCHDTWPAASVGRRSLKGKGKKRNNIYRNVQVSTCFFFLLQIVPLERNKTRLKLNQTLAKQKRSKLNKRIYINVTRKCKVISSSVYWSSNLSGGHRGAGS